MSNSGFDVFHTTVNFELPVCKIDKWLRGNKLSGNYNETNFMLLNYQKHNPVSFKVSTVELAHSSPLKGIRIK